MIDRYKQLYYKLFTKFDHVHHGWTNLHFYYYDYSITVDFSAIMDSFPNFLQWIKRVENLEIHKSAYVNIDQEGYYKRLTCKKISETLLSFTIQSNDRFSFKIEGIDSRYFICQLLKTLHNYTVQFPNEPWTGIELDKLIYTECGSLIEKYKTACNACLKQCEQFQNSVCLCDT